MIEDPSPYHGWYSSMLGPLRSAAPLPLCLSQDALPIGWSVVMQNASPVRATDPDERPLIVRGGRTVEMVFDERAHITVDLATMVIAVRSDPSLDEVALGSLIADQVIPRIASETHLVLHAAAVASADGREATIIVGRSGTGKSTLATKWCLNGRGLLGDDTVRVDGATVFPSWVGPRLWPAALTAVGLDERAGEPASPLSQKRRLGVDDGIVLAERPAFVRRLVLMDAPSPSRVSAVRILSEQALNLGSFDPVQLLDLVTTLVNAVPDIETREPWDSVGS